MAHKNATELSPLLDQTQVQVNGGGYASESKDHSKVFFMKGISTDETRSKRVMAFFFSIFNTANAALGTGVLCFPFAFAQAGWALGCIMTCICGGIICYTLTVILRCARKYNVADYQKLIGAMYGDQAGVALTITILIFNFLCCVSYLLVMGSQLVALTPDGSVFLNQYCLMLYCAIISIPLSSMSSIDKLGFTSFLGVVAVWFTVGMIVFDGLHQGEPDIADTFTFEPKAIQTFPLIMFSLFCQITIIPATEELRPYWPSKNSEGKIRFKTLVLVAICTIGMCMILYVSTGLCGYFLFGDSVQENILQNYGTHNQHGVDMPEDWSVTISRFCMALTTFFSFPVITYLNRGCWFDLKKDDNPNNAHFYGFVVIHTMICLGVAIILNSLKLDIGFVMSVSGSTCAVVIQLVFPGLMLITLGDKMLGRTVLVIAALVCVTGLGITITTSICPNNPIAGSFCKSILG